MAYGLINMNVNYLNIAYIVVIIFFFLVHINHKFPIESDKEEMRWRFIKPRIDSKCRAQRRMQREQQAKLDNSLRLGSSERTYRGTRPRLDPREKDQLLYGYSRTPDLVVRTSEPEAAVASPQGTGMDVDESQLNGANHLEQLSENEAIVEISGSPVTVE